MDLQNNLKVLSIAVKPGYEDINTLTYLRLGCGAIIRSLYITNGEAGDVNHIKDYPHIQAGKNRKAASSILSEMGGDVYFLSFQDIVAAKNQDRVKELWQQDTLRAKLRKVIFEFQPDIVLLASDKEWGDKSILIEYLKKNLLGVINKVSSEEVQKNKSMLSGYVNWNVDRVLVESQLRKGYQFPTSKICPLQKKTFSDIADSLKRIYFSELGRVQWTNQSYESSYDQLYSRDKSKNISLKKISIIKNAVLKELDKNIALLTTDILKKINAGSISRKDRNKVLNRLTQIYNEVQKNLWTRDILNPYESRTLIYWKKSLDELKISLLGIQVHYTLSDSILCQRQLTYLRIDSIRGLKSTDSTMIIIPDVEKGWILNEDNRMRIPLKLGESYRLITPLSIDYSYPDELYGLNRTTIGYKVPIYIVKSDDQKENSFTWTLTLHIQIAPRFTAEVITPIVMFGQEESITIKLTNHSRDGIKDFIQINDSIVSSEKIDIRLNKKDSVGIVKLQLKWKKNCKDGDYLIPISIGGVNVTNFAVRKFNLKYDNSKRIGIISEGYSNPINLAIGRVGYKQVKIIHNIQQDSDLLDVIIYDGNAYQIKDGLENFVNNGGHLIILSQDVSAWNAFPILSGIHLEKTFFLDENTQVRIDTTSVITRNPNYIAHADFDGWLFAKGANDLKIEQNESLGIPFYADDKNSPFLTISKIGKGKITYSNFILNYQLMNIHPGVFKLLANILSE